MKSEVHTLAKNSSLIDYLENCKIPLSRDDWAGFYKELDALNSTFRILYGDWIKRRRPQISKTTLDDTRVKDSFILALHQITELRRTVKTHKLFFEKGGQAGLDKWVNEFSQHEAKMIVKKKRDLKPDAPGIRKNWLEAMPVFNEGQPYGYVQATGQRRKVIETFLRTIKAKTERPLTKKQRGRPVHLYGFKINCSVLDQWLGKWCDQNPEAKYDLILTEALLLAAVVTDSKNPVNNKRLARLRQILRTHARPISKQVGDDFNFDFLESPATCALQIKLLREKFPPPVELSSEERFSIYIKKVLAGEPAEYPF
jgi:hypothetical protein